MAESLLIVVKSVDSGEFCKNFPNEPRKTALAHLSLPKNERKTDKGS